MDSISFKSIIGEFLGSLTQSAALTALLYDKTKKHTITIAVVAIITSIGIYKGWSGARFNPFISLGVTLTSKNPDWIRLLTDIIAQFAGAIVGIYLVSKMLKFDITTNKEEEAYVTANRMRTVLLDAMFTFMLVMMYMVLMDDFSNSLMLGIGIALVYAFSMEINRGGSGGNINFAHRFAVTIATRDMSNLFVYTIGPIMGAIAAVCAWYIYKDKFVGLFAGCTPQAYVNEYGLEQNVTTESIPDEDFQFHPHTHPHMMGMAH